MWKLCVVDDESNRTDVDLVRGEYSLGRAEESTVRLTERNISRNHARLFHDDEKQWWVEDKDSYTGSFVNGERVSGLKAVEHGDTVQLGDYRLELTDTEQEDSAVSDSDQLAKPLVDRLTIVQGPGVGTVHELTEQKLLIGRGEECKIALDDASVSRVHVEVLRTEHGLMILDQGSSNGLRINGADLPSAMLRGGDVVELGDVRLKFTPAGTDDVDVSELAASADSNAEPAPASSAGGGRSLLPYAMGAAAVAVVFFALSGGEEEVPTVATTRMGIEGSQVVPELSGPEKALQEASELAAQGSGVLAHRKLSNIPAGSELRQTKDFLDIEKQWADELLKAAAESPDREERKAFLTRVAQTPGVGSERRTRAARQLAKLESENELKVVDVSELPTARTAVRSPAVIPTKTKVKTKKSSSPRRTAVRKPVARKSRAQSSASGSAGSAGGQSAAPKAVQPKRAAAEKKAAGKKAAGKTAAGKTTSESTAGKAATAKPSGAKTVAVKAPSKPVTRASAPKAATPPKPTNSNPPELIRDNPF